LAFTWAPKAFKASRPWLLVPPNGDDEIGVARAARRSLRVEREQRERGRVFLGNTGAHRRVEFAQAIDHLRLPA
jgi:hypothetical protein